MIRITGKAYSVSNRHVAIGMEHDAVVQSASPPLPELDQRRL